MTLMLDMPSHTISGDGLVSDLRDIQSQHEGVTEDIGTLIGVLMSKKMAGYSGFPRRPGTDGKRADGANSTSTGRC